LHWVTSGLLIIASIIGGATVSMPKSAVQSGLPLGIFFTLFLGLMYWYTATCLGSSWIILLNNWKEYEYTCRKPYTEIAMRACGPRIASIASIAINITQFGIAIVYLLLISKNISILLKSFFGINISFCLLIFCVAIISLPLLLLKNPDDFWFVAVCAMLLSLLCIILICIGAGLDYEKCHEMKHIPDIKTSNILAGLGTYFFAYGSHPILPTIQHDMRNPNEHGKAFGLAFIGSAILYLPSQISSYLVYGDSVRDSVVDSLQTKWVAQLTAIFFTSHFLTALCVVLNVVFKTFEEHFDVPKKIGIKFVVIRCSILGAAVFVAISIPSFGPLLSVLGSTTMFLTSIIFPALFYSSLKAREKMVKETTENNNKIPSVKEIFKYCPKATLIPCCILFFVGIIFSMFATYSSLLELVTVNFTPPCYVSMFQKRDLQNAAYTNCCGRFQNISIYGNNQKFCSATNFNLYV
uniref:Aa_trans domain-containing protein n=1 Tax=Rhabditophanes sp. KR3021 TaxID=114890 RepID=A0AC35TNP1_9BILA